MKKHTTISLIISSYNRPDFLELILLSILKQVQLPDEVIIADDGSTNETKALIESYQQTFPIPLLHVWHEDEGFRQSAIKNKSAAKSTSEYLIFLDGDLMLHPYFIFDYKKNLEENSILVASRVFLSEAYTMQLLKTKDTAIQIGRATFEKNPIAAYRLPILHHIITGSKTHHNARGGLMGIFKKDYIKVNGFDETFVGWGREDSELFVRIINSGIKRKNLKFAAITYHLWHPIVSRKQLPTNDILLEKSIREKRVRCEDGVDKYLNKA
jgi:glycosyltransferase involved in cell wall biosynthesis